MRQTNPKLSDRCHSGDEVLQVAGFAYIAACSQFVTAQNVLLCLGGAEDRNRNLAQNRVGFDFCQNGATVFLGQIQVKEYEVRKNRVGILSFAAQKRDRLHAVDYRVDVTRTDRKSVV